MDVPAGGEAEGLPVAGLADFVFGVGVSVDAAGGGVFGAAAVVFSGCAGGCRKRGEGGFFEGGEVGALELLGEGVAKGGREHQLVAEGGEVVEEGAGERLLLGAGGGKEGVDALGEGGVAFAAEAEPKVGDAVFAGLLRGGRKGGAGGLRGGCLDVRCGGRMSLLLWRVISFMGGGIGVSYG